MGDLGGLARRGRAGEDRRQLVPDRALEQRAECGDPGRDPDLAEGVVDPARHAAALRWNDADRRRREHRVDNSDAKSGDDEARKQRRPMRGGAQPSHHEQPDSDQGKSSAHQKPDRDARRQVARGDGCEERDDREREEPQPGLKRRETEQGLDVEDEVQEHREHRRGDSERRDRHPAERRLAKQR